MSNTNFDYKSAFSRNIGWMTLGEQDQLKNKRIAIAGLGGVGGSHLLTLTRLGIGKFNIADFDRFELPNFNRQAGASVSHLGKTKVDVLTDMAMDINPDLEINKFPQGVTNENMSDFFTDVDLYVDGVDFFAFAARESIFAWCAEKNIPAVTAAPLGMGTALLNFMPGQMTFEQYFQMAGKSDLDKALHFIMGLAPSKLHNGYLVDPTTFDFVNHKGPSTPMGCELCAGVAATQALKILLNRGKIIAAPRGLHFDAYQNKMNITWRPWGNKNPLQKYNIKKTKQKIGILED